MITQQQQDAIAAAQLGDWSAADEMELAYLNREITPWRMVGGFAEEAEPEDGKFYVAYALQRGGCPDGILVSWHSEHDEDDDGECIETNIDGRIIEEE